MSHNLFIITLVSTLLSLNGCNQKDGESPPWDVKSKKYPGHNLYPTDIEVERFHFEAQMTAMRAFLKNFEGCECLDERGFSVYENANRMLDDIESSCEQRLNEMEAKIDSVGGRLYLALENQDYYLENSEDIEVRILFGNVVVKNGEVVGDIF